MAGGDITRICRGISAAMVCFASYQDIWLGERMAVFSQELKDGIKTKKDMAQWIMNNIAVTSISSDLERINREDITDLALYKKQFRVLEYQLNGNVHNKWRYNEDMKSYDCGNGVKKYYQDYEYIFVNDQNVGGAKAVWDNVQGKMLLMYWGLRDQYNTQEAICSNLTALINQYGFSLNMTFEEMKNVL